MADIGGVDTSIYQAPARPNMLERAGQAVNVVRGMTAQQQQQFDLAKSQLNFWGQRIGSMAMDPRWKTGDVAGIRKDMTKHVADAVKLGMLPADQAAVFLSNLPEDDGQLHDALQSTYVQSLDASQQLDALAAPMTQDTGGQIKYGTFNRLSGQFDQGGALDKTLSPSELSTPMPTVVPSGPNRGAGTAITKKQFLEKTDPGMLGGAGGGGPAAPALPAEPAPPAAPGGGAGAVDAGGGAPDMGGGAGAGAAGGGGPVITSLPPGEAEAMQAAAKAPGEALGSAQADAASFYKRVYPLEQAITSLERLGPQGSGPGSETLNQVMSFLQTNAPAVAAIMPGFDPKNVKDFDEANKYLTGYAMARGATFGDLTNDKLATALTANPNMHMSNLAATDVAKATLALERMSQAQVRAFDQSGVPASKYGTWSAEWAQNQDPRAFALDLMSPKAVKDLLASLKGKEREKFMASVALARKYALVNSPGG